MDNACIRQPIVSLHICLIICLFIYWSVCLSVGLSVYLYVGLCCPSICLFIWLSAYMYVYLFVYCLCLSICLSAYLSVIRRPRPIRYGRLGSHISVPQPCRQLPAWINQPNDQPQTHLTAQSAQTYRLVMRATNTHWHSRLATYGPSTSGHLYGQSKSGHLYGQSTSGHLVKQNPVKAW